MVLSKILVWITGSIQRGAPADSLDVMEAANSVLQRRLGERGQLLGRGWLQSFKKRHHLSYRVPEKLKKASANVGSSIDFFAEIGFFVLSLKKTDFRNGQNQKRQQCI